MKFSANTPVQTEKPAVVVDRGLPVGTYRFRLVVVTKDGRSSQPDDVVINIVRTGPVIPGGITPTGPIVIGPLQPSPP